MRLREPLPLIDPVKRYALFTNGKCGGTSIKAWFVSNLPPPDEYLNGVGLVKRLRFSYALKSKKVGDIKPSDDDQKIRDFINVYRKNVSSEIMRQEEFLSYKKIVIARDPYKRAISGFLDKLCGPNSHKEWIQNVVRACNKKNGDVSFLDFLNYLRETDDEDLNPHWRRQTYITEVHNIDYVIELENLYQEAESLRGVTGWANFELLNNKRQTNKYTQAVHYRGQLAAATQNQLHEFRERFGAFPSLDLFLNDEVRSAIREIYTKDFEELFEKQAK